MRKIIITFVVSVILVISGALVFAMELSQIQFRAKTLPVDTKTETITIENHTGAVLLELDPYIDFRYEEIQLEVESFQMDPNLKEDQMKIEYPEFLELAYGEEGEPVHSRIWFFSTLNGDHNVFSHIHSLEDIKEIWNQKEITLYKPDAKNLHIKVFYGKKLEGKIDIY